MKKHVIAGVKHREISAEKQYAAGGAARKLACIMYENGERDGGLYSCCKLLSACLREM